jgi:hypothetical protein
MHRDDRQLEGTALLVAPGSREHRSVVMTYQSSQVPTQRAPIHTLVHRRGWWYGRFLSPRKSAPFGSDLRDRPVEDLTPAPTPDLKDHLKKEFEATKITVRSLQDLPCSPGITPPGTVETSDGFGMSHLPPTSNGRSTTLAYGPAVKVLEPPALRVMVAEWIDAMKRNYEA